MKTLALFTTVCAAGVIVGVSLAIITQAIVGAW